MHPDAASVFEEAIERPVSERALWLEQRCDGDAALLSAVRSLLDADSRAGGFLETPPLAAMAGAMAGLSAEIHGRTPARIGPFRVVSRLGRGGMGEVYLCDRARGDFEQRVAVKLIRGVATDELLDRFRTERRVLASLHHPHIAPLLDGGADESGMPYLVMPFVDGVPIDEHCRVRGLGPREVLSLMLPVLDAVEHAHQRLVVHRDLKPANLLVDGEGRAIVLDFGIAKVLRDGGSAAATVTGSHLLTPLYASPEQIRGEPISTTSDVFSLGVVLYELLTGQSPWGPFPAGTGEVARRVCEHQPTAPSAAGGGSPGEAARRSGRALWGDLDAIVLTALRKEPGRRYASVSRLADDLRRLLDGRPVSARPDTLGYRTSRFVRRYRVAVALGCAVVAALVAGTVVSVWQASRAEAASARYRAQLARADGASRLAGSRADQLRTLATTLVFDVYDSVATLDGANEARLTLVRSGGAYLDAMAEQSRDDPAAAVDVIRALVRLGDIQAQHTIGHVGDTEGGLATYRRANELADRLQAMPGAPEDAPLLLAMARRGLGDVMRSMGRRAEAIGAYREALEASRGLALRMPADARPLRMIGAAAMQLGLEQHRGQMIDDAMASYAEASSALERSLELVPGHADTRRDLVIVSRREGDVLISLGDFDRAEERFQVGLSAMESLAAADPMNRQLLSGLAVQCERLGDIAMHRGDAGSAAPWYERSHAIVAEEAAKNPGDALAADRLSIALEKFADVRAAAGDYAGAAELAGESARIAAGLAADDPANLRIRADAAYIRSKAAHYAAQAGQSEVAASELEAVVAMAAELRDALPEDPYPPQIELEALERLYGLTGAGGPWAGRWLASAEVAAGRFPGSAWAQESRDRAAALPR